MPADLAGQDAPRKRTFSRIQGYGDRPYIKEPAYGRTQACNLSLGPSTHDLMVTVTSTRRASIPLWGTGEGPGLKDRCVCSFARHASAATRRHLLPAACRRLMRPARLAAYLLPPWRLPAFLHAARVHRHGVLYSPFKLAILCALFHAPAVLGGKGGGDRDDDDDDITNPYPSQSRLTHTAP